MPGPVQARKAASLHNSLARDCQLSNYVTPVANDGLNPEQRAAVETLTGPLLVFAGAGSGKTRVITHRIRRMILSGISPAHIVAVTFTNRAAREMKARLETMMSRKVMRGMFVGTFHSLGNRILQKEIETLPGYRTPYSILAAEESEGVLADLYRERSLDPADVRADGIRFLISLCKNSRKDPRQFAEENGGKPGPDEFGEIFDAYQERLRKLNVLDFDDLILLPAVVFDRSPDLLAKYRHHWRHFLVDEFQDTNPAQYDFLRKLVGPARNLCVVGDDDQSIYGWRGAEVDIILGFEKDFPGARAVSLERNYRSTSTILEAANAVIVNNSLRAPKQLRPTLDRGEPIGIMLAENDAREAELVAGTIQRMLVKQNRKPGDFAILFRTNFQSRVFEQELRLRDIPHYVVGGYRFFDRREVRDLIAYIRLLANPRDEVSLRRVINRPRRGIGEGTLERLNAYILELAGERPDLYTLLDQMRATPGLVSGIKPEKAKALYEFVEFVDEWREKFRAASRLAPVLAALVGALGFDREFLREGDKENVIKARMLNLSELVNMLAYMEENNDSGEKIGLFDFLGRIALMQEGDEESPRGRVQLLTMHLAKGLEYDVVFLAGLEEGIFPAGRSLAEAADENLALAEERRLFYVGITRARRKLYFSAALARKKFGETLNSELSRFLEEVPTALTEFEYRAEGTGPGAAATQENPLTDLLSGLKALESG